MNGTIKIHFRTDKEAINASYDKFCTAGIRYNSGRVKTWIAKVIKNSPYETKEQVIERLSKKKVNV